MELITRLFKSNEKIEKINPKCCVTYQINYNENQTEDIYCSKNSNSLLCTAEIEIFKKSIMEKCITLGIKEFFKGLSKLDFDINNWMVKASNMDKLKYYNILRILKEKKILNFRGINSFESIRKYLELFSKFMPTYYPLLEKYGKEIENIYNRNKTKNNHHEKMTTIKDDIFNKVIENLISQSLNEISDDLKDVIKRSINKFYKFFDELLNKGKNIDIKIFKPLEKFNKELNDNDFISKLSKNLIFFLEEYNKTYANADPKGIDEETKIALYKGILNPYKENSLEGLGQSISPIWKSNLKIKFFIWNKLIIPIRKGC